MVVDLINIVKITVSFVCCIFAIIAGIIEIKKDPESLLNRFFASFFIFLSIALLLYTLYHSIFNVTIIITLNIIMNGFYNLAFACLFMVPQVIKYSSKDPKLKSQGIAIFSIGLGMLLMIAVWPIEVDEELLAQGAVSSHLAGIVNIVFNLFRIIILFYTLGVFIHLAPKLDGIARVRMQYFTGGIVITFLVIFSAVLAGLFKDASEFIKIIALLLTIAGTATILRGFLIKEESK
jgi:hypothetical protein